MKICLARQRLATGDLPEGASQPINRVPRVLSHRRAKHQAPNPKLQMGSKPQNTNPQIRCRDKRRAGRFLSLELGASLELGVWNLELLAWALSFSKTGMRPPPGPPGLCACQGPSAFPNFAECIRN